MDGLNIDHMQAMTTQDGPFSWLTSGKVDAVLDIKFPRERTDELQINALLGELADAISTAASSVAVSAERIPGQPQLAKPPLSAPSDRESARLAESAGEPPRVLRGFARTLLAPGQSQTVTVSLRKRDIAVWDNVAQQWTVPRGTFNVFVGASSRDIRLTGSFTV